MYLSIIPGPMEPETADVSYYLRPIIDEFLVAWKPGYHLSKTPSSPVTGRDAEVAAVISVNDLPAARKVSGTAGHKSDFYCTVCDGFGRGHLYNTDFSSWKPWDIANMRLQAESWRDAENLTARENIFKKHGVRWSEFWRLPYWNPCRMLVIDSMHCILEGLVYYHCRRVLGIDAEMAGKPSPIAPAFSYPWLQYHTDVPSSYHMKKDDEIKQVTELHNILTTPFESGPGSLTHDMLMAKLLTKNLSPLRFVCYSLNLSMHVMGEDNALVPAKTKRDFALLLVDWVSQNAFEWCPKTN
jgi:hypothetical protein